MALMPDAMTLRGMQLRRETPVRQSQMMGTYTCCASFCVGIDVGTYNEYNFTSPISDEKTLKQRQKAENKAILLMQNMIGAKQCDVYRKTYKVIVKPSKWFWAIGNFFDSYHEDDPFRSKPDVIRLDNPAKLHVTYFCVDQNGGGPTPYTDKVITFATHLLNNEKAFYKIANRMGEKTLTKMPECAVMQ